MALGGRPPSRDFVGFLMDTYLYEEPLKDKPGVKDFFRHDLQAAQKRGSHDLAALLKIGLYFRLVDQGYAGNLPVFSKSA